MMHTARLPTVRVSVPTTRCQYWWMVGPQMNKVEQVSSDGHQILLAGGYQVVGYPLTGGVVGYPTFLEWVGRVVSNLTVVGGRVSHLTRVGR